MKNLFTMLLILASLSLFAFISVYFAAGKETIHLVGIFVSAFALALVMYFSDRQAKRKGEQGLASSKIVDAVIGGVILFPFAVLLSSFYHIAPVYFLILLVIVPYAIKGFRSGNS